MTRRAAGRARRTWGSAFATAVLAVGLVGFAPAEVRRDAPAVGETDLFNLEHVYNFNIEASEWDLEAADHDVDEQGTDLEFFTTEVDGVARDYAVVGGYSRGAYIFDITDPAATELAQFVPCAQPRNDVAVGQYEVDGDQRTFIGLSLQRGTVCAEAGPVVNDGPSGGFAFFDVTDPTQPAVGLGAVQVGFGGVHNLVFHPTEPLAYIWNGALPGAVSSIPIVDFSDLSAITVSEGPTTLGGPHDGELSPDGTRLYVASENNYEIFDNTDPRNPVRIGAFTPNIGTYAHGYFPTPDGRLAITNNESLALGGFFRANSGVCPGEGLAFYDTSDPGAVVAPLGYFAPPVQGQTDARACTSHFGRIADNNQVMTIGWYILGTRVIDFSDPSAPREIGAATIADEEDDPTEGGSEAWSSKTYEGPYVYVGDLRRGFDVFRWSGPTCGPDHAAPGAWPWADGWTPDCVPDGRATLVEPTTAMAPDPRELEVRAPVGAGSGYSCAI
ncbi:MAG: hypothetical protein KY461_01025 [Actinobacteria bacterium]|nr:hypothetical protein [Actinomycetota bacterium]